jgi:hypothetical protein
MKKLKSLIGISLGKKPNWFNGGIILNKNTCIKYVNFLKIISYIIFFDKLKQKNYLLSRIILIQDKKKLILNIYFYIKNGLKFSIKYKKLLQKHLLKKKRFGNNFFRKKKKYFLIKLRKYVKIKLNKNKKKKLKIKNKLQLLLIFEKKSKLKNFNIISFIKKQYLFGLFSFKQYIKFIYKIIRINKIIKKKYFKNKKKSLLKIILLKKKIFLDKFIFNNNKINYNNLNFIFYHKNFIKILKFYNRLFFYKLIKISNKKFKYLKNKNKYSIKYKFKILNLKNILYRYVVKLIYKKKALLKKYKNSIIIKNNIKNNLLSLVNKPFLFNLLYIEKILLQYSKILLKQDILCHYYIITNYNFTSQVLVKYISIKLKQKFSFNQVIRPLVKYLNYLIKKKKILFGYRLELSGRFSRKQRATFLLFKNGKIPLGTIYTNIDYKTDFVILKNGLVNIKIWLNKTEKFKNSIVNFQTIINEKN